MSSPAETAQPGRFCGGLYRDFGPGTTDSTSTGPEPYTCQIDNPVDWTSPNYTFTTTNVVQATHGGTTFDLPVTPVAVPAV
jgi:hypothetical protein